MLHFKDINQLIDYITPLPLVALYISRPQCSVCLSVQPKIEKLLANYSKVKLIDINVNELNEIAGYYTVFTAPVIILINEGKELYRQARFIQMDELAFQLDKYTSLLF